MTDAGLEFFVDFGEVEESRGFEAVPPGRYNIIVDQIELKDSQSSEHKYLNWQLTIADGEYHGRKLWHITSFAPGSLPILKTLLKSGGLPDGVKFRVDRASRLLLSPDLVGYTGSAKVKNEVYDGDTRAKVTGLQLRPRDGAHVSADGDVAKPAEAGQRRFI